jgi:hypothetical protein
LPYQFPYFPKFFKDDLKYATQINIQESEVTKTLNFGTLKEIANTVSVLEIMVTKKMIPKDDPFESEMDELNDMLEDYYKEAQEKYNEKIKDSICPDVLKKPNRKLAPRWFYENKLSILFNFFDRLGLGLEHEREGYF